METEVCSHYRQVTRGLTLLSVGMIQRQTESSVGTRSDDKLEIPPPIPSFIQREMGHEATNRVISSETKPPSRQERPLRTRIIDGGDGDGIIDGYKGNSGSGGQRGNRFDHRSRDGVSQILTPPPRSSLRPKLSHDRNRLGPYASGVTSPQVVDLGLSSTPPRELHVRHPRPLVPKIGRSVAPSVLTDATTFSSLLDPNRGGVAGGRFGTDRTATTEATSYFDSDSPSGADFKGPGPRDRKPGETTGVDLTRVAEETEGARYAVVSRLMPRDKPSGGEDGRTRIRQATRIGKGKWPDDFFPHGSLSPGNELSESPRNPTLLSATPPRKLAIVGKANGSTESLPQYPRRPSHRSRHSIDTPVSLLPRDASPDNRTALLTSKVIVPHRVPQSRIPSYFGRGNVDDERRPTPDARVPFPRSVSASRGQLRGDDAISNPASAVEVDKPWVAGRPMLIRGRAQSEIDNSSSKRKSRPTSTDVSDRNPRRSRFESMVNLGVAADTASDPLNRNAPEKARPVLLVREEGKPTTQFVSIFSGSSLFLFPVCGDMGGVHFSHTDLSLLFGFVTGFHFSDTLLCYLSNSGTVLAGDSSERYTGP